MQNVELSVRFVTYNDIENITANERESFEMHANDRANPKRIICRSFSNNARKFISINLLLGKLGAIPCYIRNL